MYECVDKDPESIPGSAGSSDPKAYLQLVEPKCNGMLCPPYDAEKELTCAGPEINFKGRVLHSFTVHLECGQCTLVVYIDNLTCSSRPMYINIWQDNTERECPI